MLDFRIFFSVALVQQVMCWLIRQEARVRVPDQTSKRNTKIISSAISSQQISGKHSNGDFFSVKKMSPCYKVHKKKIADQPCYIIYYFLFEKDRTQILKKCMPVFTTYGEVLPDRYFFDFKCQALVSITKKKKFFFKLF